MRLDRLDLWKRHSDEPFRVGAEEYSFDAPWLTGLEWRDQTRFDLGRIDDIDALLPIDKTALFSSLTIPQRYQRALGQILAPRRRRFYLQVSKRYQVRCSQERARS
jgi:hypothetical protein